MLIRAENSLHNFPANVRYIGGMKRTVRKAAYVLLLTLSASLLFGCGGGSSSSGVSQNAGIYAGTLNVGTSSPTFSGNSLEYFRLRVNSDGTVTDLIPDPNCSATEVFTPKADHIEVLIVKQCFDSDLGSCTFVYEGSFTFLLSKTGMFVLLGADFACDAVHGYVSTFGTLTKIQ